MTTASQHYLCIHCHFYQPPRENPWLEAIENQESASPFHDWNERISAECYRPNGLSRILDGEGWVVRLANNYARVSYNFGATLLSWMKDFDPVGYEAVLEGDRQSVKRFGGHGSAIAQVYNHVIMPLANRRDKVTQVRWGLADFERHFKRKAEAMWLAETAVDIATLEVLADHGLKFVILAPRQAAAFREIGDPEWTKLDGNIDPKRAYKITLPNGKSIAAFFYDGPISQAVAFERLLNNGETFAKRLVQGFDRSASYPQLLHIATDGESYGHHHRHGDMALAYALEYIEQNSLATIVNYGQFLEMFPPEYEVRIHENSSWSCVHGVERWRSDCGCNSGGAFGWRQQWRGPLRDAIDMLRDRYAVAYEEFMDHYTDDPWGMRDDYIAVILDRTAFNRHAFFRRWLRTRDDLYEPGVEETLLKALELQRNLLLAYTSCAWFFDEISGIETVQNIQYAARAIEHGRDIFGIDLEAEFRAKLKDAPSNIEDISDGREVYDRYARPAAVDKLKVTAHLAVKALFENENSDGEIFCFDYRLGQVERRISGKTQMLCATVTVSSRVTLSSARYEFCIVHWGDHNLNIGVRPLTDQNAFATMVGDFDAVFGRGDLTKLVRLLDRHFGDNLFALSDLFRDQQKEVINTVYHRTLESVEDQFNNIYDQYYPVMCYLSDLHMPQPTVFSHIARFVQTNTIKNELARDDFNVREIHRYISEAGNWGINLASKSLEQNFLRALDAQLARCKDDPSDTVSLQRFADLVDLIDVLPFDIELGMMQNEFSIWGHDAEDQPYAQLPDWQRLVAHIANKLKVRFV